MFFLRNKKNKVLRKKDYLNAYHAWILRPWKNLWL